MTQFLPQGRIFPIDLTMFYVQLGRKIREMFTSFDSDSDGFLDQKEMKAAFASMVVR